MLSHTFLKSVAVLCISASAFAQGLGGKAGVGGKGGFGGGAVAAPASPTLAEVKECDGTGGNTSCSLVSAAAAGNTIIIIANDSSGTCNAVSSTPSNVFQPWFIQSATIGGSVFVARNVAASTNSFVATCTGSAFSSLAIFNYAPAVGQLVVGDVFGSATGTGGPHSVSTVNPVGSSVEEVIASVFENSDFFAWTPGTGYTTQVSYNLSAAKYLGIAENNNTKTGLTGAQTATFTSTNTFNWLGLIITAANVATADAADTIITFEGLSNTVVPTTTTLGLSTFGVPLTYDTSLPMGGAITGATGSQGFSFPASHTVGATAYTGSGSLGLAFATGTGDRNFQALFPVGVDSASYILQFKTTLPQNDTALNAYSLIQITDISTADYLMPQLQASGTALAMALECKTGTGSGTVPIASNTNYYLSLKAVNNSGTHQMKVYDSTGVQTGSTITCTAEPGATKYDRLRVGVTGADPESAGSVLSFDNLRLSLQGTALTP